VTRFMLSCLRQRILSPTLLPKMERRFRELAAQAEDHKEVNQELADLRFQLAEVQSHLKTISGNMALAKTPEQFEAISATFDQLKAQETSLLARSMEAKSKAEQVLDAEAEIARAMEVVQQLADVVSGSSGLELAAEAFRLTNARLFLRYCPV
jgi:uncharacterized protein (DUF3084 family)